MKLEVRSETDKDRGTVHALNAAAFGRATEALLVDMLRTQADPVISLVAQDGDAVVGHALVRAGLERCKELGAAAAVVLGHPEFYPKFGFLPAALREQ